MSHPVHDLRGLRALDMRAPSVFSRAGARVYGLATVAFHRLHDTGLLPRREVRLPVVSVGALTVGGAGKTPLVRWLAAHLVERGRAPAILSRGYGRTGSSPRVVQPDSPDVARNGDEPVLLARSLPGVPVIVGPDRARLAGIAAGRGADVLLLDDGFQHRRLARQVDVVIWDRAAERSHGRFVPAGRLREGPRGLRRAHAIVAMDRGDGPPGPPPHSTAPVFHARLTPHALQHVPEGTTVHAVSGLADPASFERSLGKLGLAVTGATRFADHHAFTVGEILRVAERAAEEGADILATTAKDFVRWPRGVRDVPVPAVFDVDVEVESGEDLLALVESRLERRPE